jgi:hypothetical protein
MVLNLISRKSQSTEIINAVLYETSVLLIKQQGRFTYIPPFTDSLWTNMQFYNARL